MTSASTKLCPHGTARPGPDYPTGSNDANLRGTASLWGVHAFPSATTAGSITATLADADRDRRREPTAGVEVTSRRKADRAGTRLRSTPTSRSPAASPGTSGQSGVEQLGQRRHQRPHRERRRRDRRHHADRPDGPHDRGRATTTRRQQLRRDARRRRRVQAGRPAPGPHLRRRRRRRWRSGFTFNASFGGRPRLPTAIPGSSSPRT